MPILTVFGATTCEDTALVRSRLECLEIRYTELDVDLDPDAQERLHRLSGTRVTPTLVFGPARATGARAREVEVFTEPSLERLDELLADHGHAVAAPAVGQFHGQTITRPIPLRALSTPEGTMFSLEQIRSRQQVALFLAHDVACLACFGYAKQLARQASTLAEADAIPIVAAAGEARSFAAWRHEMGPEVRILIDPDGAWKRAVLMALGRQEAGIALLMLDRFAAPRAGSFATEAGCLANPSEAAEWLGFIALDCPECSAELPWPESGTDGSGEQND